MTQQLCTIKIPADTLRMLRLVSAATNIRQGPMIHRLLAVEAERLNLMPAVGMPPEEASPARSPAKSNPVMGTRG